MLLYFFFFFSFRLLQEDPKLFQLYKDLVVSQLMTAEEFWANHSAVSYILKFVSFCLLALYTYSELFKS